MRNNECSSQTSPSPPPSSLKWVHVLQPWATWWDTKVCWWDKLFGDGIDENSKHHSSIEPKLMENEGEKTKGRHGEGYERYWVGRKMMVTLVFFTTINKNKRKRKELDVLKFNITHLKERKGRDNPIPACEKIYRFVGKQP